LPFATAPRWRRALLRGDDGGGDGDGDGGGDGGGQWALRILLPLCIRNGDVPRPQMTMHYHRVHFAPHEQWRYNELALLGVANLLLSQVSELGDGNAVTPRDLVRSLRVLCELCVFVCICVCEYRVKTKIVCCIHRKRDNVTIYCSTCRLRARTPIPPTTPHWSRPRWRVLRPCIARICTRRGRRHAQRTRHHHHHHHPRPCRRRLRSPHIQASKPLRRRRWLSSPH